MKKSIFAGIFICLVVIAGAYYMFLNERPVDNLAAANIPSSSITIQQNESTVASESISQNESSNEGDIKIDEMGNTVSTCDFNYTVNSITKTNELGEYPKNMMIYFDEPIDEKGKLEDGYSYIFINMTIENTSSEPIECTINSCGLIPSVDSLIYGYTEEMRFFDKGLDTNGHDFFHYTLEANEKQTYNVGFIVEDEDFSSDNLLMLINPRGRYPYDETARYISLHY